jgi:Protein of unknown function (DUF3043)
VFRRRNSGTADSTVQADLTPEADSPAVTAGKGRPTPKRSEAEKRRRPYTAPADRKEANRQYRDREKATRSRRLQGMQRGEQWAMPPRDRGPVKALARDYVDSKRRFSEYYMYGLLVLLVMLLIPVPVLQTIVPPLVMVAVVIMLVEGFLIGRKVRAIAAERLPGESTQGVRMYAAMRTLQIRKLRVPKPRVKPGDSY